MQYVSDPSLIKLNVIEFHELKEKCRQFFSQLCITDKKLSFLKRSLKMPSAAAFYRIIIFHYKGFPSKKSRLQPKRHAIISDKLSESE